VYIDLTDIPGGQREAGRVVARLIQKEIFLATGLTCSIGVAPNKLMAKLASEMDKPNGITVLSMADLAPRIWPLPCRALNGIGPKSDAKLSGLGIHTLGDLATCDPQWLVGQFGKSYGQWLHQSAHGIDERPVQTNSEPVSISRETTFERNLHAKRDRDALGQIFTTLCERLADDLVRKAVAAQTVGIKLRDDRFKTITRDLSLEIPIRHATDIRYYAGQTLKRAPLDRPLRLLGVKLGKLVPLSALPSQAQPSRRVAETGDLFS
jgi:DNA polymerase-4